MSAGDKQKVFQKHHSFTVNTGTESWTLLLIHFSDHVLLNSQIEKKKQTKNVEALPYFIAVHKIAYFYFTSHAEHISLLLSS